MTKDKAIEILANETNEWIPGVNDDLINAFKLGGEALKQVKDCMSGEILSPDFMLPSETKD